MRQLRVNHLHGNWHWMYWIKYEHFIWHHKSLIYLFFIIIQYICSSLLIVEVISWQGPLTIMKCFLQWNKFSVQDDATINGNSGFFIVSSRAGCLQSFAQVYQFRWLGFFIHCLYSVSITVTWLGTLVTVVPINSIDCGEFLVAGWGTLLLPKILSLSLNGNELCNDMWRKSNRTFCR